MRAVGMLVVVALVGGCGAGTQDAFTTHGHGPAPITARPEPVPPAADRPATPRVVGTIADHLSVPWGIAFLPDGSALVTERDSGRVLHVVDHQVLEVGRVDSTGEAGAEGGLLGIAVSPSYAADHRVFLYATTGSDNRVLRTTYTHGRLGGLTPILTGIPRGPIHDGGRLAFGPDHALYVSTGETGNGDLAQDPRSLGGKILRITEDGKPAPGNPDPASPVWTLGHRNVQGLAWDAAGRMWASEFGASTWDELNLIRKGTNYGWPVVEGEGATDAYRNPIVVWRTSEASPSGLAFADGHLWLGSLAGQRLWRVTVDGSRASDPTDFFVGAYGRLRTVALAPDGHLWITTSNRDGRGRPGPKDDRILEVAIG